jgi:hypothetical protein
MTKLELNEKWKKLSRMEVLARSLRVKGLISPQHHSDITKNNERIAKKLLEEYSSTNYSINVDYLARIGDENVLIHISIDAMVDFIKDKKISIYNYNNTTNYLGLAGKIYVLI